MIEKLIFGQNFLMSVGITLYRILLFMDKQQVIMGSHNLVLPEQ